MRILTATGTYDSDLIRVVIYTNKDITAEEYFNSDRYDESINFLSDFTYNTEFVHEDLDVIKEK
jgi:hypothetical protein